MKTQIKTSLFLAALAACPLGAAKAADPATTASAAPRPAYTVVSYDQDWSFLADPATHNDLFDPIKYLPLDSKRDVYLSLGGQFRERYEYFNNLNFGAGKQSEDGYFLTRMFVHADLHIGPFFRGYVEGISAMIDHRNGGPRPTDSDEIDFSQAFVDFTLPFDAKDSLTFRAGRQDLLYGAQRLISPLDWVNTRRTFDGVKLSLSTPGNTLDAFAVRPVLVDDEHPDPDDPYTTFTGVYDTLKLPQVFSGANTALEMYALSLNKTSRGAIATSGATAVGSDTYTLGTRFSATPRPFDFDSEFDYQFGRHGRGDISAWSVALEGGYTFDTTFKPRVYVGFDATSGDGNPKTSSYQTFNQLFPLGHAYFGYIDVIGRQNIVDLHPGFELTLAKNKDYARKLALRTDYHLFWRQSDEDAVYNAAGGVLRASATNRDSYIGSEVDLIVNWQINQHLLAYIGYSHFFAGDFINHTGSHSDIDFAYTALQCDF